MWLHTGQIYIHYRLISVGSCCFCVHTLCWHDGFGYVNKKNDAITQRNRGQSTCIKRCLAQHLKKHPLATEEDVVKFVFQGMLGVGHLITSHQQSLGYIISEMNSIEADETEPLTEKLSTFWLRLNLRAAKAQEMNPTSIDMMVYGSAKYKPVDFTRQNVYNFCMKLEGFEQEKMRSAAEKILDENWLPSHSESYRNAYHPAYRVVYKDFRKMIEDEEE